MGGRLPPRARELLAAHRVGLAAILLGTLLNAAVVTDGTFELAVPPSKFVLFYDDLGDSLLEGRFDVPVRAIGSEAFVIDGKTYGYFGPTPALLRIPLNALFPGMRGLWTRSMMIAAALLTLVATYLIRRTAATAALPGSARRGGWLDAAFVVCAAAGTSMLFISRRPIVYHEALAFGVAFAMWTYVLLLRYAEDRRLRVALAAAALALLSFQARVSVGAGALGAVLLLAAVLAAPRRLRERWLHGSPAAQASPGAPAPIARSPRLHAVALAATVLLSTSALAWKNRQVFGSITGMPPISRHIQLLVNPERLAKTGGSFFQPVNLRTMLYNYFDPARVTFVRDEFPFVFPATHVRVFPETRMDHVEEFASLTAVNPLWLVLAAIGIGLVLRPELAGAAPLARFRVVLAGAAAGAGSIFVVACVTHRALHDVYPLLIVAGACGVEGAVAVARRSRAWRALCLSAGTVLALYTCYANAAVTLTQARW
ncbi:MAG TPA: hypothetical protein VFL83_22275 [Anaeromyxobacter sp.]|nr:hypothetical protein [Anaeromyxobacter sp.]